ncbi:hypothetical protein [Pelagicoccus albus]|uniref:Uncharacterized protein n=1 Tax=Pelagicoccus albus TaxID=415222 RepID=A0A7X1B7P3_9BACT|nr:hypothetical protein [Pelagicoccus albus]MBC2607196.1 hypothetical protein [Pelagicoccus albus]
MSEAANYSVSESQKQQFAGIYLLEYMINAPKVFQLMLEDGEEDLESILEWLLVRDLIEIKDQERYAPTEKGRKALEKFMGRYSDFLTFFDVFCAVDLGEGSFAFADYYSFDGEDAWRNYLAQERWEDLRVAVANYKGIDPVEIVFMSFLNEGRFGRTETGWEFDLLLGSVWDEILQICNSALQVEQLGYDDDEGEVPGEAVIQDVIAQGLNLIEQLHQHGRPYSEQIAHAVSDGPSASTVEAVEVLKRKSNDFDNSPTPPDRWKDDWDL